MTERPRFAVDVMLGSLARWLRIMGYDAAYQRDKDDSEILEGARREGRIVLTRDKELAWRMGDDGIYVESDDPMEQLDQVSEAFGLSLDESHTRCTVCNGELEAVDPSEIDSSVPPGALESNDEFYRCLRCGKVYWRGSHWTNIRERIASIEESRARSDNSPR